MAYLSMMPPACIWLIDLRVSFTAPFPCKHCEPTSWLSQAFVDQNQTGGRQVCRLPSKPCRDSLTRTAEGGCRHMRHFKALRGFSGLLGVEGLLDFHFGPAHAHLDLLGLGFGLLGQSNLQHALVV